VPLRLAVSKPSKVTAAMPNMDRTLRHKPAMITAVPRRIWSACDRARARLANENRLKAAEAR
jgi:hypothetical protein